MILDSLRDFEWLNDPLDVSFAGFGMVVSAKEKTDFWQNKYHKVSKDNGHFFYTHKVGDFTLAAKWSFEPLRQYEQCGIMVRIDDKNWLKVSIMHEDNNKPKLGTGLTQAGLSDWAAQDIPLGIKEIWYKIKKNGKDYIAYYSLDGVNFIQIRLFSFITEDLEVKVGAYMCSPIVENFEGILCDLNFV